MRDELQTSSAEDWQASGSDAARQAHLLAAQKAEFNAERDALLKISERLERQDSERESLCRIVAMQEPCESIQ
jgi:hypothetical protein